MKITKTIIESIFKQALDEAPLEACGYLAGVDDKVIRHYPMTNIDKSEEHFSFDPKEQFKVVKDVRNEKLNILGVYHSHPSSPARPSEEDLKLAYDPNINYVIVSLFNNVKDIKAFKIIQGNVLEDDLIIEE